MNNQPEENGSMVFDDCIPTEPVTNVRLILILWIGCAIASIGLLNNFLLFAFFLQSNQRSTPSFYLGVLALLDLCICFSYILVMGGDAMALHYELADLWIIWNQIAVPFFTLIRIVVLAIPYIILFASLERLILASGYWKIPFFRSLTGANHRYISVLIILCTSILLRISSAWEIVVIYGQNCSDPFGQIGLVRSELFQSKFYVSFTLYFIPTVQVFLPVVLLLIINIGIIRLLRINHLLAETRRTIKRSKMLRLKAHRASQPPEQTIEHCSEIVPIASPGLSVAKIFEERTRQKRERSRELCQVRSATYTLVAIVTCYLVTQSFSLVIRILEQLANEGTDLITDGNGKATEFYTLATDAISFLVTFNSSLRIVIHLCFNKPLRKQLKNFFFASRKNYTDICDA